MEYTDKLIRDYNKDPLKYGECPPYEDLYFLYIECNLTCEEIAPYFGFKSCTVRKNLKKLGIEKPLELKVESIKRKTFEKYGDTSYSRLPECREKVKQTSLKHFGTENPNQCQAVKDKIAKTNLERYGFTCSMKNEKIKEKVKQTNLERYGKEYFTQTEEYKKKNKQTCLERYGVEHNSQAEEIKERTRQTNIEKYGVPYPLMLEETIQKRRETNIKKWGTSNISTSHINPEILKILNDKDLLLDYINQFEIKDLKEIANTMGISYDGIKKKLHELNIWDKVEHKINHGENELQKLFPDFQKTRQILKPQEIDLYNDKYKLGIEFNGNYWHSEVFKDKNYHQQKSLLAKEHGIFLYHIFEYEWKDPRKKNIILSQLNNLIGKNIVKIGARKCIIKELDNKSCQEFLQQNHLQGKDQSSIRLGLYYNEEIVSVMTFCKPRFNNKYEWELSRFCNKLNTTINGAASKLFKYFITKYNPKSIISYSNLAKTKGNIYSLLGFQYDKLSAPNYVWHYGHTVLSRYQCQKHKLTEYYHLGKTEDEIMKNRGYSKIFDCGNLVWIWKA